MPNWVLLLVSSLREKVTINARYRDSPVMNARLFTAYHSIFLIAACSYHFLAPEGSTTLPGLMSRALSPYQLHPIMAPLPEPVLRVPKALHIPTWPNIQKWPEHPRTSLKQPERRHAIPKGPENGPQSAQIRRGHEGVNGGGVVCETARRRPIR